jgi:conjugative relaxase-like TrwC/TraI family protein
VLSIGKLVSARYYLDSVAKRIEDYYAGVGEAPGVWLGGASRSLGLAGEVADGDLEPLLSGLAPDGTALVSGKAAAPGRLPGFDLTFSVAKSVTLLYALGDPRVSAATRAAHDHAVGEALGYLEEYAVRVRRGKDGVTVLPGDGLVGAAFRHRSSRAGDPQLHTHVLVMNVARGPDGRWSALDGTGLYAHARTAGFLYQAALRAELTATLGVGWGPVRRGVAEVAGFSPAELGEFSRRRAEIEERMAALGTASPRGAQIAALDTRQAKKTVGRRIAVAPLDQVNAKDYQVEPPALIADWRRRAQARGLDETVIAARTGPGRTPNPLDVDMLAAVLLSPDGLTAHASSFDRRDVLRGLAERAPDGASVAQLEAAANQLLTYPGVVRLDGPTLVGQRIRRADGRTVPTSTGHRFTTADLLAVETALLDAASARIDAKAGVVWPAALTAALAARPALGAEQQQMITRLVSSGAGIEVVVGAAGTGKTFGLEAARAAWQACGMNVIGAALSARAAGELAAGSGIASTSIAKLLHDTAGNAGRHGTLPYGTVLVVDEAGMVGTRTLARLAHIVELASGKLVLVGDPAQLPEIDAGGTFRALAAQSEPVTLSENRRQTQAWERAALADLRAGRVDQAVAAYDDRHRIHFAPTAEAAMGAMVGDWWAARQSGAQAIMIGSRRATIGELNRLARAVRIEAGELAGPELQVGGRVYAVRDEVIGLRNDGRLGMVNGDIGTVTRLDPDEATITVALPARRGRPERAVVLPSDYVARHVDCAYALTAYKAQGVTVDATFSFGDDTLSTEAGYTNLSRGRISNELYWVAAEPAEPLHDRTDPHGELRRALTTSRAQHSATSMLGEISALAASCTLDQLEDQHRRLAISIRHHMPVDASVDLAAARRHAADIQTRLNDNITAKERFAGRIATTPLRRRNERAQLQRQLAETDRDTHSWAGRLPAAHQRVGHLEAAQDRRQEWIDANTPRLVRYAQLAAAITRRQTNLVAIATVRPPAWLTDTIGPYPDSPGRQRVWRRQARALLSTHDRQQAELERPAAQPTIRPERQQARSAGARQAGVNHQHGPDIGL